MNDETTLLGQYGRDPHLRRGLVHRRPGLPRRQSPSGGWSRRSRHLQPVGGLEIVLVNDGSPDNSGEVMPRSGAARRRVPLTYVEHARNFGEHNAVMTGLRHARGAYVDHDG